MATASASRCLAGLLAGLLLYASNGAPPTQAAASNKSPDETYLDALQGPWTMAGTFGGLS